MYTHLYIESTDAEKEIEGPVVQVSERGRKGEVER